MATRSAIAGNVTRAISRLKVGDTLGSSRSLMEATGRWRMPLGKNLIIVAGGIGLAPLRPVILSVLSQRDAYGRVLLLYGARTPADLLYTRRIRPVARRRDRSQRHRGRGG